MAALPPLDDVLATESFRLLPVVLDICRPLLSEESGCEELLVSPYSLSTATLLARSLLSPVSLKLPLRSCGEIRHAAGMTPSPALAFSPRGSYVSTSPPSNASGRGSHLRYDLPSGLPSLTLICRPGTGGGKKVDLRAALNPESLRARVCLRGKVSLGLFRILLILMPLAGLLACALSDSTSPVELATSEDGLWVRRALLCSEAEPVSEVGLASGSILRELRWEGRTDRLEFKEKKAVWMQRTMIPNDTDEWLSGGVLGSATITAALAGKKDEIMYKCGAGL